MERLKKEGYRGDQDWNLVPAVLTMADLKVKFSLALPLWRGRKEMCPP